MLEVGGIGGSMQILMNSCKEESSASICPCFKGKEQAKMQM